MKRFQNSQTMGRLAGWLIAMLAAVMFVLAAERCPAAPQAKRAVTQTSSSQPAPQLALVLPGTATKAYLRIPDYDRLHDGWSKTELARLMRDESMEPFLQERRGRAGNVSGQPFVGLTWDDLNKVAGGAIAGALVEIKPGQSAIAWMVDTHGREAELHDLLAAAPERYRALGAQRTARTSGGVELVAYAIPAQTNPAAPVRVESYFRRDGMLVFSNSPLLVALLASRWSASSADSLARLPAYASIMEEADKQAAAATPAVETSASALYWYIEPWGCHDLLVEPSSRNSESWQRLKRQGFTAVQAIGGTLDFSHDSCDVVQRIVVYAPGPFTKTARMLDFTTAGGFALPNWIRAPLGRVTSLQWNLQSALLGYGSWFDEVYGEGEDGIFEEVLIGIRDDPGSPGVDVRKDLLAHLESPVLTLEPPATGAGMNEESVMAVKTTGEKAVAEAVRKMLEGDPQVVSKKVAGHTLWLFRDAAELAKEEGGQQTSLGPDLSNHGVVVAFGYLMVSSRWELLETVLASNSDAPPLAERADFKRIASTIQRLSGGSSMLRYASQPGVAFRPVYQRLKAGKVGESPSFAGQLFALWVALAERMTLGSQGEEQLSYQALPPFQRVTPYLHGMGLYGQNIPNGWLLVGFIKEP